MFLFPKIKKHKDKDIFYTSCDNCNTLKVVAISAASASGFMLLGYLVFKLIFYFKSPKQQQQQQ